MDDGILSGLCGRIFLMAEWFFISMFDLFLPLIMIGFGKSFMKEPPGEINSAYGYRTRWSSKNWDTWTFAHQYIGAIWYRCGRILLKGSIFILLLLIGRSDELISKVGTGILFVQMIPCIGAIIPTEIALRKTFDKDGMRRQEADKKMNKLNDNNFTITVNSVDYLSDSQDHFEDRLEIFEAAREEGKKNPMTEEESEAFVTAVRREKHASGN